MNYLKGITFNNQSFNPKNDGRIYEKIYGDCILSGCALTYSGTDIYMAVGDMIVGGRLINVDSAVTIATSATYANGYGRLKISVDLTRTSTTETNQQAAVEIEYAATNAFADLTQGDINGSDTLYEAELAIVQFESGNVAAVTASLNETTAIQPQLNSKQEAITSGTSAPSGGSDGDIYLQYT